MYTYIYTYTYAMCNLVRVSFQSVSFAMLRHATGDVPPGVTYCTNISRYINERFSGPSVHLAPPPPTPPCYNRRSTL